MSGTRPGAEPRSDALRRAASLAIVVAGFGWVVVQGLRIYLADGSYFLGEASVVLSLDGLSALETFQGKLLGGGQNFPRLYLLAIRGVRWLLGDSTWATRMLPQLCFLAGTALWMRLFFLRFRSRPLIVLLGVLLVASVPTWPIYSAAVKQYSFDTFCALLLFSVPERWLDDALAGGRRRGRLVWLLVPTLFSFTYGVVLLARVLGWWAFGLRRRGPGVDGLAAVIVFGGLAAFSGLLWWTDVRHTLTQDTLFEFWDRCTLPAPAVEALRILDRFFLGFYEGRVEIVGPQALPLPAHAALLGLLLLGAGQVLWTLQRPRSVEPRSAPAAWGSRSAGCAAGIVGTIATSFVLDYPVCSGRLLLYVLFMQQIVLLEGVGTVLASGARLDRRLGTGRLAAVVAAVAVAALAFAVGGAALHGTRQLALRTPIEDVRPQLAKLRTAPELPVVVTACMERQIRALPEGLGMDRVVMQSLKEWVPLPHGEEVWVIHSRQFPSICHAIHEHWIKMTTDAPREPRGPGKTVLVYRTRLLTPREIVLRDERRSAEKQRRGSPPR